jgi:hypothetical protein
MFMRFLEDIGREELLKVSIACILTSIMVVAMLDLNSVGSDETAYLFIGKNLLQGKYGIPGQYPYEFFHRPPIIPSLISLSLLAGIGLLGAQILVPLLFMNLVVITTYIFTSKFCGKKEAMIATAFVFTFPFFWRWGLTVLTDVPLALFSLLFSVYFFKGVEEDRKYLMLAAVMFSLGLLTKTSMAIFALPALLYLLLARKWRLMLTKEFLVSLLLVPIIFFSVFMAYNAFSSVGLNATNQSAYFTSACDISDMSKLLLAPTILFSLLGIFFILWKRKFGWNMLIALNVIVFFLFFAITCHVKIRLLSPLIPYMGMLAGIGFLEMRGRIRVKKAADALFILLFAAALLNAFYLVDLDKSSMWGVVELSDYVNSIEGEVTIASEYSPDYLRASTSKHILTIPIVVEFDGKAVEKSVFIAVRMNLSHPDNPEYLKLQNSKNYSESRIFDYGWFRDNGVDYVIISVYDDYERTGVTEYFNFRFATIEIPFIKRPYSNGRVPPDYTFRSDVYEKLESSDNFQLEKEILNNEGQTIFIIYEVMAQR